MKHPEGLRMSLVEEGMLDGSGVLKSNAGCTSAYGLPEDSVALFLTIAAAGENGIAQTKLPKDLKAKLAEALLPLELDNLVAWERDNRGRQTYLVLTWKGKDALEAARTKPTNTATWAARRKASVTPSGEAPAAPSVASPPATDGVRRRAAFAPAESETLMPPAPQRSYSEFAPAAAAAPALAAPGGDADFFAPDLPVGDIESTMNRPLRRRVVCKADDELLSSLTFKDADGAPPASDTAVADAALSDDGFDTLFDLQ